MPVMGRRSLSTKLDYIGPFLDIQYGNEISEHTIYIDSDSVEWLKEIREIVRQYDISTTLSKNEHRNRLSIIGVYAIIFASLFKFSDKYQNEKLAKIRKRFSVAKTKESYVVKLSKQAKEIKCQIEKTVNP